MGEFIIGVVVDVCGHVLIKDFNGVRIAWIPGSAWDLVVLDSSEFVVLDLKVGLEYFRRGREPEHGGIAFCDIVTRFCRSGAGQYAGADGARSNGE